MSGTPYFDVLMGDAKGYDVWARQLAAGDWIGNDVFYQAPLYPYFAGLVYAVFGADVAALRIAQAIVGALSCVLVGYAGAWWFSRRVGLVAGLMLALYAPAIFFDGIVQKSVLDVFFVCAALAILGFLGGSRSAGGSEDPPLHSGLKTRLYDHGGIGGAPTSDRYVVLECCTPACWNQSSRMTMVPVRVWPSPGCP